MRLPTIWLLGAALAVGVLELLAEGLGFGSGLRAAEARMALESGRHIAALEASERSLQLNPWDRSAAYSRCVALKRLGRWQALAEAAAGARVWAPDGYSLLLLEGEAAFVAGRAQQAADALWLSFTHTPRPRFSAAQLWRMAMLAGRDALGAEHPRTQAAATVVLRLAPDDPHLPDADRLAAIAEAKSILGASRGN